MKLLMQLKALGNEKMRAQNAKNGAGDNQFGVSLGDIRGLSKKIRTDPPLALSFWKTGNDTGHAMEPTQPHIFRILLEVSDMASAAAFYSALLALPGRPIFGGRHYFDCGEVIVGFVDVSAEGREPRPTPQYIYFAVTNLEEIYRRAEGLGALSSEEVHSGIGGQIAVRPWGERSFYAKDPFGNLLCFVDAATLFTG